jgi:tetratricopeptide (TPR) repeat protein
MEAHERRDFAEALRLAREAVAADPGFAEAHEYLGTTLVTRLRRFSEGIAELERGLALAPDSASLLYALGWCCEFAANALRRDPARRDEAERLYDRAAAYLRRCLEQNPQGKLREDAEDLLAIIEAR